MSEFCTECVTRKAAMANNLCLFCSIRKPRELPLCSSCGEHPQAHPEGLCFRCDDNILDLSSLPEDEAVRLGSLALCSGKRVHLPSSRSAGTLVARLAEMTDPEKTYDLGLITVPGTNIFCPDHQFIDRESMPQIAGMLEPGAAEKLAPAQKARLEPELDREGNQKRHADGSGIYFINFAPEFVAYLESLGFASEEGYAFPGWLRSTQKDLSGANVARLVSALDRGEQIEGLDKPIFVSREGYIIDGHHRWAAFLAADSLDGEIDGEIAGAVSPLLVCVIDIEITEALDLAHDFSRAMRIIPDAFFQSD